MWYAIEKLFMRSIGFNDQTIALETVLFTVGMMIANIPMGILADRWSRKGVLMLASGTLALCAFICALSDSFWPYTIGIAFWGIFYACYDGTYDAIIYDVLLEETSQTTEFEHYYGRLRASDSIALVLGSLMCSVVVHFLSLRATYILSSPFACASIVALMTFKDTTIHKQRAATSVAKHIRMTFKATMQKGQLRPLVACTILLGVIMSVIFEFDQFWLNAIHTPTGLYGPINAFILSGFGVSGLIAKHIKQNNRSIVLTVSLMVTSLFLLRVHSLAIIVGALGVLVCSFMILEIILSKYLHDILESQVRSSTRSVVGTLSYLTFLPVALLFGRLSKQYNVFSATWVIIVIGALVAILLGIILAGRPATLVDKDTDDLHLAELNSLK